LQVRKDATIMVAEEKTNKRLDTKEKRERRDLEEEEKEGK